MYLQLKVVQIKGLSFKSFILIYSQYIVSIYTHSNLKSHILYILAFAIKLWLFLSDFSVIVASYPGSP